VKAETEAEPETPTDALERVAEVIRSHNVEAIVAGFGKS